MTPTPEETDLPVALVAGAELVVFMVMFAVVAFVMVWAIVRLSVHEPPVMVTAVLGLLTLVAIAAAVATGNDSLTTLAATGVGALAGAVTNLFTPRRRGGEGPPEQGPNPD